MSTEQSKKDHRDGELCCAWPLALTFSLCFFLLNSGLSFLNVEPATGGDMGSHFYSLWLLKTEGFQVWSPAHLMGELSLVHYFPGPFFVMLALSWVMPLGLAFNLGTVLPLMLFPFSVFFALRGLGVSLSQAFLALLAATLFAYNESFAIWGGNGLSLLAGQFAHLYALVLLFLFVGSLGFELRAQRFPFLSALWLGLIPAFHTYVYIFSPLVLLAFWLRNKGKPKTLKILVAVGGLSVVNALWFVWPQIHNSRWTTTIDMRWEFGRLFHQAIPLSLVPLLLLALLLIPLLTYFAGRRVLNLTEMALASGFWLIPAFGSVVLYLLFPLVGLTNVRALPQGLIFLSLWGVEVLSWSLRLLQPPLRQTAIVILLVSGLWWTQGQMVKYPQWFQWNYSGWQSKPRFASVQALAEQLSGDFSMGRVVNEHHPDLNQAGTTRVFEMFPYWSQRATIESLYAESTHTSFLAHDIQARLSDKPSCFLHRQPCPRLELEGVEARLQLLGIQDLILVTEEAAERLRAATETLDYQAAEGFHLFSFRKPTELVEVLRVSPQLIARKGWREDFIGWYQEYRENLPHLLALDSGQQRPDELGGGVSSHLDLGPQVENSSCASQVDVKVNKISFNTECPGAWHLLKFSYHPYWQSSETGEEIYLVSPGFMALRPTQSNVTLSIKTPPSWWLARALSLLSAIGLSIGWMVSIISGKRFEQFRLSF